MKDSVIIELVHDCDGDRRYFGNFEAMLRYLNPSGCNIIDSDIPFEIRALGTDSYHRVLVRTSDDTLCLDLFSELTDEFHIRGIRYAYYN